jgi:hypothetical protein
VFYIIPASNRVFAMFARLFISHPQSVGEGYFEHQRVAFSFAGTLLLAGCACLLHAFVPGVCERTASKRIEALHGRMIANRRTH